MENALANLSTFGILGVVIFLFGIFLVLAGAGIIKLQKISVLVDWKTWLFGIICLLIGGTFLFLDARASSSKSPSTSGENNDSSAISTPTDYTMFVVWLDETNGCIVTMNGYDDPDVPMDLRWEWGDNTISEGEFPQQHKYPSSGTYTLKVSDPFGNSSMVFVDVTCP